MRCINHWMSAILSYLVIRCYTCALIAWPRNFIFPRFLTDKNRIYMFLKRFDAQVKVNLDPRRYMYKGAPSYFVLVSNLAISFMIERNNRFG